MQYIEIVTIWSFRDFWCRIRSECRRKWGGLSIEYKNGQNHYTLQKCRCPCLIFLTARVSSCSWYFTKKYVNWDWNSGYRFDRPGDPNEMSSVLADPNAGGGVALRGLSQWVQLCTWSPNKLWRSNSILNLVVPAKDNSAIYSILKHEIKFHKNMKRRVQKEKILSILHLLQSAGIWSS